MRDIGAWPGPLHATDDPFEPLEEASEFIDHVTLDEGVRAAICSHNARRLLRLPGPVA